MGTGAGHMMDMLKRLQANKAARTSQKTSFKQHGHIMHTPDSYANGSALCFREFSPETQQQVICEMRYKRKRRRKRQVTVFGILFLLFAGLLLLPALV